MRTTTPILMALILLCACTATATPQLVSDVTAYSQWAITRKPSTYAFERLPAQQARAERQQAIEDAARGALEAAGFTPAADSTGADVIVQVGARARTTRTQQSSPRHKAIVPGGPTDFPGNYIDYVTTDRREVALLIRDRESGGVLYGGRASNRGRSVSDRAILAAMFEATMQDFPSGSLARCGRGDVLQLEGQVRRHGRLAATAVEGAGGRERPAQEDVRRAVADASRAAGCR
jgi:Domain of unknown function (DUF4136)